MRNWASWALCAWAGVYPCACEPASLRVLEARAGAVEQTLTGVAGVGSIPQHESVLASVPRERPGSPCADLLEQVEPLAPGAMPTDRATLRATSDEQQVGLPLQSASYSTFVVGTVAETLVTQRYFNPLRETIEAVYVFPLPHDAAVHDYAIRVQGRTLRGEMKRRAAARALYEQAKREGKSAGLLEQERPNVFTQSVANIPPGETIEVELRMVQPLAREHGRYRLVLPTVVGPRYVPGTALGEAPPGAAAPNTDRVADGSRVTPSPRLDAREACTNVSIAVAIENGSVVRELESKHHDVEQHLLQGVTSVELSAGTAVANRDFDLSWSEAGDATQARLMIQPEPQPGADDGGYFTLTVEPPAELHAAQAVPRELVFVVDTSGSMMGEPIAAAKDAMRKVLARLGPQDVFQIVEFSEQASSLAPGFLGSSRGEVQRGLAFVDAMSGHGGTEMLAGVRAAFALPRQRERLRMVLLLTDGYIGNDSEVLAAVRAQLGDARLFSLGVGSSVNRHLLDGLARLGRGAGSYLSPGEDASAVVERFYARIDRPALTDLALDWGGLQVSDVEPQVLPDLFAGQPLVVFGRYRGEPRGDVALRGWRAGREERVKVSVDFARPSASSAALSATWARARIARLEDDVLDLVDERAKQAREDAVTALALEHHVMTRHTAFVAVDEARRVQPGNGTAHVSPELPEGVDPAGVFGALMGTGRGGGGSGQGTIGLGNIGTIGHGAGGGVGYGYGDGFGGLDLRAGGFRGRAAEVPRVELRVLSARGASKEVARRIGQRHLNELRFCYEQHASGAPDSAELTLRLAIGPDGQVQRVELAPLRARVSRAVQLHACLSAAAQRWLFPLAEGSSTVVFGLELHSSPRPPATTAVRVR